METVFKEILLGVKRAISLIGKGIAEAFILRPFYMALFDAGKSLSEGIFTIIGICKNDLAWQFMGISSL